MVHDGCWSTVICSARERAELGETSDTGWVLGCRLSIGHRGDHASDAETAPRFDRRLWLEWNDHEQHAQSLIARNPCTGGVGARCMLFEGHGGVHWYAPTNGYLTAAGTGRRRAEESTPPSREMATADHSGGHHSDGHHSDLYHADVHHAESPADFDAAPAQSDSGSHRVESDDVDSADLVGAAPADIPNLRGRAVRGHSSTDGFDPPVVSLAEHTGGPSVSEALDVVIAALAQLADAIRRTETTRD